MSDSENYFHSCYGGQQEGRSSDLSGNSPSPPKRGPNKRLASCSGTWEFYQAEKSRWRAHRENFPRVGRSLLDARLATHKEGVAACTPAAPSKLTLRTASSSGIPASTELGRVPFSSVASDGTSSNPVTPSEAGDEPTSLSFHRAVVTNRHAAPPSGAPLFDLIATGIVLAGTFAFLFGWFDVAIVALVEAVR